MKSIAVFCGSSVGKNGDFFSTARALGSFLADNKIRVIYGGAKIGLMGAVANGALENEGEVVGVIPDFLQTKEVAHDSLTELITVKTMHERKTKMSDLADGFIVLPGGFGTMEEFFEILTWAQLGLHKKPIALLNIDRYYDALIDLFDKMISENLIKESNRQMVLISDTVETLFLQMKNYQAPKVKLWISETERT
ncbi:MAG: TIGR00730 family Rossman fold protein [Bacteroidota bacterium]